VAVEPSKNHPPPVVLPPTLLIMIISYVMEVGSGPGSGPGPGSGLGSGPGPSCPISGDSEKTITAPATTTAITPMHNKAFVTNESANPVPH